MIEDEEMGAEKVREEEREVRGDGVDAVPHIRIEGRRRDFTFEGAREVEEYAKGLMAIVKESA